MKNLTIPCPFCDVDNRLTVFQAERATMFQVKCNACAREFEIDAEGRIVNLGIQEYPDLPGQMPEVVDAMVANSTKKGTDPPTETRMAREIRELEEEIDQAEREEISRNKPEKIRPPKNEREVGGRNEEKKPVQKPTTTEPNKGLMKPPKQKGNGPSIVPITPRKGGEVRGAQEGPKRKEAMEEPQRNEARKEQSRAPGSGPRIVPIPPTKDMGRKGSTPSVTGKTSDKGKEIERSRSTQPKGPTRKSQSRDEMIPKRNGPKKKRVEIDDELAEGSPHDPLLRPTSMPFPFPYPFQMAKPPFLKNPDNVWKLLITSAVLGIITILLLFISINNWLDGSVEDIRVEGTVTSIDGEVIPNATVALIGHFPNATSDADGRYSMSGVNSGTHTFRIAADGYYTIYFKTTILSDAMLGQSDVTRDFELTKMENGTHQPDNIDDSNEKGLYFYPTLFMINAVIAFLGGISAKKFKNWKFCVISAIAGIFSFGLIFVSSFFCIIALVILVRTQDAFQK